MKKSYWQKLDNWVWYDNHIAFEYQVNCYTSCMTRRPNCGLLIRSILLLVMVGEMVLLFLNTDSNPLPQLKYITYWGVIITFLAFVTGLLSKNNNILSATAHEVQDLSEKMKVYSPFVAWKWFIILY